MIAGGCATTVNHHPSVYLAENSSDYPVKIIAATFVPEVDINIASTGKSDAALKGAGMGALAGGVSCSPALAYGPIGAALIFAPCVALTSIVGGAVSAWEAAPKNEADMVRQSMQYGHQTTAQSLFAEKASAYLSALSTQSISLSGPELEGPKSPAEQPEYRTQFSGTLLEMSLLRISYQGSGKQEDPVCLTMAARGRKLNAATGTLIRELARGRTIKCQTAADWLKDSGANLSGEIEVGYRILAEDIVDKLYLIYHSPKRPAGKDISERPVPEYVLAPIKPRAPEMYLDLRSITKKAKHVIGWGGMHFVDVDNLTPSLSWEAFPRSFDMPSGKFSDISYDVRIYTGSKPYFANISDPEALLHEASGLIDTRYSITTPLKPCSRYFWTVRARFTLNGLRRVTEWAGAYQTLGGEVSPSHLYFYPFRTPSGSNEFECWS